MSHNQWHSSELSQSTCGICRTQSFDCGLHGWRNAQNPCPACKHNEAIQIELHGFGNLSAVKREAQLAVDTAMSEVTRRRVEVDQLRTALKMAYDENVLSPMVSRLIEKVLGI